MTSTVDTSWPGACCLGHMSVQQCARMANGKNCCFGRLYYSSPKNGARGLKHG